MTDTSLYPHGADLATARIDGITLLITGQQGQAVVFYLDARSNDPLRPVGLRRYQPTGQIADIVITGDFPTDQDRARAWLDEHGPATALSLIAEINAHRRDQNPLIRG